MEEFQRLLLPPFTQSIATDWEAYYHWDGGRFNDLICKYRPEDLGSACCEGYISGVTGTGTTHRFQLVCSPDDGSLPTQVVHVGQDGARAVTRAGTIGGWQDRAGRVPSRLDDDWLQHRVTGSRRVSGGGTVWPSSHPLLQRIRPISVLLSCGSSYRLLQRQSQYCLQSWRHRRNGQTHSPQGVACGYYRQVRGEAEQITEYGRRLVIVVT